ncbi:MAG: hypothetical protein DRQ88_00205 [Epsilonproteobacteria bacterium]|nr:MAG: hypothetical protein DRQ89_06130 [Campylobacterota bacterium]RLA68058.1 MAG: hypothetical protein DRQ88_00205 [Campylobacterota bacterium]
MKRFIALTFLLILASCAKAPNPISVSAIKRELVPPAEFNSRSLQIKKNYQTGTEIFNFFLWPNVSREEKVQVSAKVAQLGLQIEEVYKRIDVLSFEKSPIEKKVENLEANLEKELAKVLKNYKCWVNSEDSEVCGEAQEGELKTPEECWDLEDSPWNSEDLSIECEDESEALSEEIEERLMDLEEELAPIEDKISEELEIVTAKADAITDILEGGETNSDKWQFWFQTKVSNVEFIKGKENPNISLSIKFNNVKEGAPNRFLRYKFDSEKDDDESSGIIKVKQYLDGPIPTLEFEIHEKRALLNWKEELTGIYYKVVLRENELDFGLELLGEIEKFNSQGFSLGKGMMKIYLKPKY